MGVEYKVSGLELAVAVDDASLEQFRPETNRGDGPAVLQHMATVPLAWLQNALPRLSVEEQEMMLRHKVIPYVWLPHCVIYGVATEDGLRWAESQGLNVVGRIKLEDYRSLVRRTFGRRILFTAVTLLERTLPWASARRRLTWPQIMVAVSLAVVALASIFARDLQLFWIVFNIIATTLFCLVVGLRCLCLMPLPKHVGLVAPLLPETELPTYTVLVPLFRETAVLPQLLHALSCLDYPPDKLDIKIILEENDKAMQAAVAGFTLPDYFDVLVVPEGKPQTKPRALNYAMQFARGDLLTIYDSEDIPQPNQLKLAAAQLAASGENVACLQAALEFYNPNENWLTRQFTAEYAALFHTILPTLAAYKLPLPLGGTSNHFRVSVLRSVGGWDPYNVTEDADLGIRLARYGYQTRVLHSSTYEEANPEIWNWLKQRRRWLKGFLQCWLVHNRNPLLLLGELKFKGFIVVQCMTLGIFLSSLLHPILLGFTIWNLQPGIWVEKIQDPIGGATIYLSIVILLLGYLSGILLSARGLRTIGIRSWGLVLLSIPAYWFLMSAAAWLALWDFCVAPYHWHKTRHGLSRTFKAAGQRITSRPSRR
jgi:glycosyltransferase XagB